MSTQIIASAATPDKPVRLADAPEAESQLPDPPPAFAPPDPKAFHGLLGEIVRTLAPETEADPVAILGQLLVGFGNMAGRHPHVVIGGDRHHLNLNVLVVGDTSSGGKGMSLGRARQVLAKADPTWAETCVSNGISSGEGLIYAVRDPDDANGDPGVADKRLLVVEEEWERVQVVAARDGSTVGPILRSFFDTGHNRSMKVGRPYRCTNAHISIIAHATASLLQTRTRSSDIANGSLNRFLILRVRRSKLLPFGGDSCPAALNRLVEQLQQAVKRSELPEWDGEIGLTQQARDAWPPLYARLTAPTPGPAGMVLARGAPIVRRIAAIYALTDNQVNVRLADIEAAMALWEYACRSVASIFGSSTGSADADRILQALKDAPQGLTRTNIIVQVFQRNLTKKRIVAALTLLRDNGWAHATRTQSRGGPVERWFAGPAPTN